MEKSERNIFDLLKNYGLDVETIVQEEAKTLIQKGFEKVSDSISEDTVERIDCLLQYIPAIAGGSLEKKDIIEQINTKYAGAFRVYVRDGGHLAKSRVNNGAYRASILSDVNNKLMGQAELFEINNNLAFMQAPKYAVMLFDSVSAITGQYYMAEINHKLDALEKKTNRIIGYMENATKGNLWANGQTVNYIIQNMHFIKNNELQKNAYYHELLRIKNDSLGKLRLFDFEIEDLKNEIKEKSKIPDIKSTLEKIYNYFSQQWYTIYLYASCIICEIAIADIYDPVVLTQLRKNILFYVDGYKTTLKKIEKDLADEKIRNAKAFNIAKVPDINVDYFEAFENGELWGLAVAALVNGGKRAQHAFSDSRKKKMEIELNSTFPTS